MIMCYALAPSLAVSDCRMEDVWIYQDVCDINVSERAVIAGYTIKLREISNNNAMLILYQGDRFKDVYVMSENDTETYLGRFQITLLQIGNESVTVKACKSGTERLWTKEDVVKLKIGENFSTGSYLISAIDFEEHFINLSIHKNDAHLALERFDIGDSHVYDGELKVYARYACADYCTIETYRPSSLGLIMSIDAADIYQPDQAIECRLSIQNDGIPIRNALLEVTANGQKSITHYQIIKSSNVFDVTIDPPVLPYQSNISIVATLKGHIWNGDNYSANYSREVTVAPYIMVEKSVSPAELTIHESAMVTITVRNLGINDTDIRLTDIVPEAFETNTTTEWTLQVEHRKFQNITYLISSMEVGTFDIPACTAGYEGHSVSSLTSNITVHGPEITAVKMMEDTLDEHTKQIIISIENTGDRAADIEIIDEIPPDIIVISCDTDWHGRILPQESYNYSYIIQFRYTTTLPSALIRFVDDHGNRGTVKSNSIIVDMAETSAIETTTESITPAQTPSTTISRGRLIALLINIFILLACIFSISVTAGYMLLRNRSEET